MEVGAEVSGVVQSLAADYNSLVHAGQVVATLDPASFVAQLRIAEAAHAQTRAAFACTRRPTSCISRLKSKTLNRS